MDFSVVYLARRLLYRFIDFFHHWYVDGSRSFGRRFMTTMTAVDQSFAIAITLRHLFEPLYKDYSPVGRVLGVVFRIGRIIMGGVVYILIIVVFALLYIVWLAIPALIIINAVRYL